MTTKNKEFHLISFPKGGQPAQQNEQAACQTNEMLVPPREKNHNSADWIGLEAKVQLRICRVLIINALHLLRHMYADNNAGPDQSLFLLPVNYSPIKHPVSLPTGFGTHLSVPVCRFVPDYCQGAWCSSKP